ncbi:MAG: hypothetical protein HKN47_04365 [Pirellulaceae bacterium]|nr:hypothetical protein [Pirellulaceae bacterium]
MLTVAQIPNETVSNVSNATVAAQNETLPSDAEISRRVNTIRSTWSKAERVQRRREAEVRFADLMCALMDTDIAA